MRTHFHGINRDAFTEGRSDWQTPDQLFYFLNREFGFSLDVCAADARSSKCGRFYSPKDDSLRDRCDWRFTCWMNPPYGREIGDWVYKAWKSAVDNGATVVCLLPVRTDTAWWHEIVLPYAAEIRFIRGRLRFDNKKKDAPFPSVVVVFKPPTCPTLDKY